MLQLVILPEPSVIVIKGKDQEALKDFERAIYLAKLKKRFTNYNFNSAR